MRLDDALGDRQTQTRSLCFGGKEWLEDARAKFKGDSGTLIADCNLQDRPAPLMLAGEQAISTRLFLGAAWIAFSRILRKA